MNRPKRLGTKFESDVVAFLKEEFPAVERRALAGSVDKGDLIGLPGNWVCELKARRDYAFSRGMQEARTEALNAGATYYTAIFKYHRHSIADSFVIMDLGQFRRIVKELS